MTKLRGDAQSILRSGKNYAEQAFQLRLFRPLFAQGCDAPAAVSASSDGFRRAFRRDQSDAPARHHCDFLGSVTRAFFLIFLFFFLGSVHAAFPPSWQFYMNDSWGVKHGPGDEDTVCRSYVGAYEAHFPERQIQYIGVTRKNGTNCEWWWNINGYISHPMLIAYGLCPVDSTWISALLKCSCNDGFVEDGGQTACVRGATEPSTVGQCKAPIAGASTPFPILPASAEKYRSEIDFDDGGPAPLTFGRTYRSNWGLDASRVAGPLGKAWTHSHTTSLSFSPATNPTTVSIFNGEGSLRTFFKVSGAIAWTAANSADTLLQNSDGSWSYRRADDGSTLSFTADGRLQTLAPRNGWATVYTYNSAGQLATIGNGFGRFLALTYNSVGQVAGITTPDLRVVAYSYDAAGRLSSVTYPDGNTRGFLYENANFPYALTGILDETGARFATFAYDSQGRAIDSALAAGADRHRVSYPSATVASVIDPLGTTRTYSYSTTKGKLVVADGSLPSGRGESDARRRIQDDNGLITSETDFKDVVTTTTWDVARRLPTTVVRAAGTTDARTTTTQWHPIFSLPALVTEFGRTTAYTYDTVGNTLSKTVTDTVTNKAQLWQWTYNALQLVATATEPNGAVTSYTYDTRGNALTSTNALGHVTTYTYDNANRVASTTAPNGLVTTYTYDLRDRLLTQTVGAGLAGAQTTTLTYKPFGTVESVTLPTGLVLTYTYDAAHRLIGWSSNRGESGSYTLDGMGNRTTEQIKNSAGAVAWSVVRTVNKINRPLTTTEGSNQSRTFWHDANGDFTSEANGFNESTQYGLDRLRRVVSITDAANAVATLKYNALDAVIEAKDFKGVVTGYTRDAQGSATAETSADTGGASTQYDSLGLPNQITDALGQATTITRDALGRPTSLVFADGKTTTLRYDLAANSKGYLSEVIDRSGTTEYIRDAFGRVTLKKQTLATGVSTGSVQQVSYGYNANGTLASIGYPNGATLTHLYDATGRLAGLNWNGSPLVTGIAWNPLGQPTAWQWAFAAAPPVSVAASRVYDTAGRLTGTEFSSYVYDVAGRIDRITQNLYRPGDADPTHTTVANGNVAWNVVYSPGGRITSFGFTGNTAKFGYDANGNRTSSTRVLGGQSTERYYIVGAASNWVTGFVQTINGGTSYTRVTYGHNANGDLVTDGLRSYAYDAEGRLAASTTGATDISPTTRYAHNALGQRVFKTEPLYPPSQGDEADPGFMQSLIAFFTRLWSPATSQAEQQGYTYVYDEQGTLIAEVGSGGTNSGGQAQYIYLPTANGPMPIAAVINGATYAVHSDHLNTPRKLTDASGQAVWQWSYSAFGEDKPTMARNRFADLDVTPNPGTTGVPEVKFNLRYPGQYADEESGLFYNGYRTYGPSIGRYTQGDPIGLDGGWNRFGYVDANPMSFVDPEGLAGGPPRSTPRVPIPGGGVGSGGIVSSIAEAMRGSQAGAAGAEARALAGAGRGAINPPIAGGGAKMENITPGEALRIQNAANRTGVPICVVGSRANGTARPTSDWDYVIPPTASRSTAHSLKSSLPEGPRGLGEPRNLDLWRDTVNTDRPHIIFPPN
ncbi:RHS repeat-associated protein [Variovorax boronicumulans]|uniref:RHS repeat-associated core domain-containing protein n=1 Tax=Variovorax boronicumulans TaxID=436515 RepID=UPI002787E547|nr:RHS repeat-associated core domain-containing protein [Variovorax boronicumulans]MDP9918373.1 RHS repeat-associated protein [Variovorax boronicumulans]